MNEEYYGIVRAGLMTLDQLRGANQVAAQASFLPTHKKASYWQGF